MEIVIQYEKNLAELTEVESEINKAIAVHQQRLESLKAKDAELREAIKEVMKREGIKKYESEVVALTYIPESERQILDSKKLKDEEPELWSKYSKISYVSDSVRIKAK